MTDKNHISSHDMIEKKNDDFNECTKIVKSKDCRKETTTMESIGSSKTSEVDVVTAIEGGLRLLIHMMQQNKTPSSSIEAVVRSALGATNDLKRMCTRRRALTRKMARVVADQRDRVHLLEQKERDATAYRGKIDSVESELRKLASQNERLREQLREMEKRAVKRTTEIGSQTEPISQVFNKENDIEATASQAIVESEKLEREATIHRLREQNATLREDMRLLVEGAKRRDREIETQQKVTQHLECIIRSQKKMIRALRDTDTDAVAERYKTTDEEEEEEEEEEEDDPKDASTQKISTRVPFTKHRTDESRRRPPLAPTSRENRDWTTANRDNFPDFATFRANVAKRNLLSNIEAVYTRESDDESEVGHANEYVADDGRRFAESVSEDDEIDESLSRTYRSTSSIEAANRDCNP